MLLYSLYFNSFFFYISLFCLLYVSNILYLIVLYIENVSERDDEHTNIKISLAFKLFSICVVIRSIRGIYHLFYNKCHIILFLSSCHLQLYNSARKIS